MNIEKLREYCLSKPQAEESFPFDGDTLVFKVAGKMFAVVSLARPDAVTLKCEPQLAEELRARHAAVSAAWHFNKRHWNTVGFDRDVADREILAMVDHSYAEVVKKLPRKARLLYNI